MLSTLFLNKKTGRVVIDVIAFACDFTLVFFKLCDFILVF
jgi:hypothetical protein